MNSMFELIDPVDPMPALGKVEYGTAVLHCGHVYIKLDKRKTGAGLTLKYPSGYSILFNPVYGTIRAVKGEERVTVVKFSNKPIEIEKVKQEDMHRFLK